jgi:uncharacterized RmlC-like cupin family protein
MASPIAQLRDDFADNTVAAAWTAAATGSATVAETGGQAVLTLPNATAGSHLARYTSTAAYDLTGDGFVWNIGTMLATSVAATAFFQLFTPNVTTGGNDQILWRQLSNAITARTIVAGVDTQLFTAAWSASTYKYLRIRESAGTIFFDSSTNGTSWTNRASVATPFAVTSLSVQFAASCGNVASPGSLRLDDVNLILPALTTNWRWTQVERSLIDRYRSVTIAIDTANTAQGYIAVATAVDSSGNLVSPVYYSGPIGSASGGYNALTLAASQAVAQASAVNLPLAGRWDLPTQVEARFIRLYHRSVDGSAYTLREYYPRRLVQSDDIEAESIQAINIGAGQVTADKIFVLNLAAVSAQMGALHMDGVIDIASAGGIYQGSGTFATPTTGLKIFNSGGVGKISTYNATVEQVTLDTDGKLKAGAGKVLLDAGGIKVINETSAEWATAGYKLITNAGLNYGVINGTAGAFGAAMRVGLWEPTSQTFASWIQFTYVSSGTGLPTSGYQITLNAANGVSVNGQLNTSDIATVGDIGVTGKITTSDSVGFGDAVQGNIRLYAKGADTSNTKYALFLTNSAGTNMLYARNDGAVMLASAAGALGFFGSGGTTKQTITGVRTGTLAQLQTVVANMLTALASHGLWTNSTT